MQRNLHQLGVHVANKHLSILARRPALVTQQRRGVASFDVGAAGKPHPRKKKPPNFPGTFLGEDAFFTHVHGHAHARTAASPGRQPGGAWGEWAILGVADGVSGAGEHARLFSQQLMANASTAATRLSADDAAATVPPLAVLDEALSLTRGTEGRATACIVTLEIVAKDKGESLLHAVNVGDSGFWVLRVGGPAAHRRLRIVHQSRALVHAFNFPFQLGLLDGVELNTVADAERYKCTHASRINTQALARKLARSCSNADPACSY
jgi:hypothetical protein